MDTQANILIIDDEVGMREGCRRALTPHGFHVITAEHGAEGLRKLREASVDLVLLDAMMPGLSGLELLDRIRLRAGQLLDMLDDLLASRQEDLPYIFQEFYRSEAAKAQKELGTGLGLPIVNQIVENHGGTIEVESQPARGTAFVFRLPPPDSGP